MARSLAQLVELMATTRNEATAANAVNVTDARRALADIGDGAVPQVRDVRNAMLARIERYAPAARRLRGFRRTIARDFRAGTSPDDT